MHCTDVVGYVVDADIYCPDCCTEEQSEGAVFADTETDCPYHCGNTDCEALIRESLTSDGVEYVRTALRELHEKGEDYKGRAEIVEEWGAEWEGPWYDHCHQCSREARWEDGDYREEVVEWNAKGEATKKALVFFCEDCAEEGRLREKFGEGDPVCPTCSGPGVPLGEMGRLFHFRCRDCGIDFSREALGE